MAELAKETDAMRGLRDIERKLQEHWHMTEEITALRNFLQIALDEHDDHFGKTNADKYPNSWDVQARKRLNSSSTTETKP